jgi:hypothetical protein
MGGFGARIFWYLLGKSPVVRMAIDGPNPYFTSLMPYYSVKILNNFFERIMMALMIRTDNSLIALFLYFLVIYFVQETDKPSSRQ